ncbi:MAG: hypothetical protein PWQ88_928 [Candidatus Methanomethylophilaceae archaeon]|nr:hypothetical protein [Candidatus Methanomethylophilaceae archaeon]MDI3542156.1 hypothetical protein [Candidatus Methanomethylophilaceae archaeon]
MELQLVNITEDTINISVKDPDMTLINPVLSRLLDDEDVLDAEFTDVHPELEAPTIMVKVNSGKPKEAFERVLSALTADFHEALESLNDQL